MKIDDVLASRLRVRILKILVQVAELNVSEIARRLSANYKTTKEHLKVLEREGMVKHKVFGRIHLYRIDESSPKVKAVQNLMRVWESMNGS